MSLLRCHVVERAFDLYLLVLREVGLSGPDYRLPAHGFMVFEGGEVWKEGVGR